VVSINESYDLVTSKMSYYRYSWHHLLASLFGIHFLAKESVSFLLLSQPKHSFLLTKRMGPQMPIARWWSSSSSSSRGYRGYHRLTASLSPGFSLAGPFLIQLDHGAVDDANQHYCLMSLISIQKFRDAVEFQEGNNSCSMMVSDMNESSFINQYLMNYETTRPRSFETVIESTASLSAEYRSSDNVLTISSVSAKDEAGDESLMMDQELLSVLAKVLAHHLILSICSNSQHCLENISVVLPDQSRIFLQGCHDLAAVPWRLFGALDGTDDDPAAAVGVGVEMVEMVDQRGTMIGAVPRSLVHQHNLLHRGVGIFVTKEEPIRLLGRSSIQQQPDLYVHRRTATKRIFPSLYDMFVGGVSTMMESPLETARREVGEELGLRRAHQAMTGPVLQCMVCTAYNRCVVDLFCYTTELDELIQWQAEEVSWGEFVPYAVVEAAADRSIERCDPWPGILPKFQSRRKGQLSGPNNGSAISSAWESWDFVPDGLLVWEAWVRFLDAQTE
jgi:isopentenyldiphosphate isomerase